MPYTSRFSQFAAASALATLALSAGACSKTIQMDSVKQSIQEGIVKQVGLTPDSVTCPTEPREAKPNDTFDCVVVPKEGGKLTVTVTQTDAEGNINWKVVKTEGLLDLTKVEASVKQGLKEQANTEATVSCGGKWKGAKKGDAFDCEATTAAGETVAILVSVTDDDGNVQWGTR